MTLAAGIDVLRKGYVGKIYPAFELVEAARIVDPVDHEGQVALATVPRGHVVDIVTVVAGLDLGVTATLANVADPVTVAGLTGLRGHNVGTGRDEFRRGIGL